MALKITLIDLAEKELEDLLFNSPDLIEPNLKMLARQHPTDSGPLDLLGVDEDSTLVVCELKAKPDELHLDQGMRYYDWCRENIAWLHKSYPQIKTDRPPRLILIAPSFTTTVKRIAKYVQVELQLLDYQAIQDGNSEKGIVLREVKIGQPPDPPQVPTFPEIWEYLTDDKVKLVLTGARNDFAARTIELRPLTGNWVSLWFKGKRFAYLGVKKKFFVVETDDIPRQRIATHDDWKAFCDQFMEPALQQLEQGK